MYEIYEKLLKIKGIKSSDVSKATGISNMTFSDWKNGKSTPKPDKLALIADYFGVTIDFLMGRTDMVVCPICGFGDNPLSEQSRKEHQQFHKKFGKIKEKYPFFMNYREANIEKKDRLSEFRNPQKTLSGKIETFEKYLEAAFSLEICQNDYNIDHLNYEEFCKIEVGNLEPDWAISHELIDMLIEKYGVDKEYLIGNAQLIARASRNDQLMRILRYAESLPAEMLNAIEIQLKALAEQNDKE